MFAITGRVVRILRAADWQIGSGTMHGCLLLVYCNQEIEPVAPAATKLPWPVAPKFVAIWDRNIVPTLSPLWTQCICCDQTAAAAEFMSLRGPEGKVQRQLGEPWTVTTSPLIGRIPVFRAIRPVSVPVKTIATLTGKHVAAMLTSRAGVAALWSGQRTMADLMALVRRLTKDVAGPYLQIRDSILVPHVIVALATFIRPAAARALPLPEALALAHYIAENGGPEHGRDLCRHIDLLVHDADLAGMPLPHRRLQLQAESVVPAADEQNEEEPAVETPERARAGLHKTRSLPTAMRPLVIAAATDQARTIAMSGYDMAAARLLQLPGMRVVLYAWCGAPGSEATTDHVHACLAEALAGRDMAIVAPNDAIATAIRLPGRTVHSAADALSGRLGVRTYDALVIVEAHVLGARTFSRLCCALLRPAANDEAAVRNMLVLIGDPQYSWGAADGSDGGAPFRDAWACGVIERGLGARRAYGPFGRVLPAAAHTAALMDDRDATLVVASCVTHDTAAATVTSTADTLLLFAAGNAGPRPPNDEDPSDKEKWKHENEISAGEWLLLADCGERRQISALGRIDVGTGHFICLRGPFRLDDADVIVRLVPCAAGGPGGTASRPRNHRLCCGTADGDMVRLAVHHGHVHKASPGLPVRLAAAVLPGPAVRHVVLRPAVPGGMLSIDDVRTAGKLAAEWLTIDYGRPIDDAGADAEYTEQATMRRRARGRPCSSLFELLRGPENANAADAILQRMRDQMVDRTVTLTTATALCIKSSPPPPRSEPINNNPGGNGDVPDEDQGVRGAEPPVAEPSVWEAPPAHVVADMLPGDFEEAVRDRLTALMDARALIVDGNAECGAAAQRYPFSGRLAALVPAARALAVMDSDMRERVALAAACKICRGNVALETWLVECEAALMRVRGKTADAHCAAVQQYMASLRPLAGEAATTTEMGRALAGMQAYLLENAVN